jgi:hypothetical protein
MGQPGEHWYPSKTITDTDRVSSAGRFTKTLSTLCNVTHLALHRVQNCLQSAALHHAIPINDETFVGISSV